MKNHLIKILILFLVFTYGCQKSKKEELIGKLTNGSYKYWDIVEKPSSNYYKSNADKFPVYCYYFNINGYFNLYLYPKGIRMQRVHNINDDVIEPDTWEYKSDSAIVIQGDDYVIKKLTSDTLILISPSISIGTIVLAKSEQQ